MSELWKSSPRAYSNEAARKGWVVLKDPDGRGPNLSPNLTSADTWSRIDFTWALRRGPGGRAPKPSRRAQMLPVEYLYGEPLGSKGRGPNSPSGAYPRGFTTIVGRPEASCARQA